MTAPLDIDAMVKGASELLNDSDVDARRQSAAVLALAAECRRLRKDNERLHYAIINNDNPIFVLLADQRMAERDEARAERDALAKQVAELTRERDTAIEEARYYRAHAEKL